MDTNANVDDASNVLVLKSSYNLAWNYFSARELGETVTGYWKTYLEKAKFGTLEGAFPILSSMRFGLNDVPQELCSSVMTNEGPQYMPDMSKTDILGRRWLVSRKRTRNLFDLTSLWKKAVITRLDEDVLMDDSDDSELMSVDSSDRSDGIDPNFYIQQVLGEGASILSNLPRT